jgi:hypothetical protein
MLHRGGTEGHAPGKIQIFFLFISSYALVLLIESLYFVFIWLQTTLVVEAS